MKNPVRVIPCLDFADGRVVKGVKFEGMRDAADPAEAAAFYCAEGADELAFLDIAATVDNRQTRLDAVRKTVAATTVPLTVGGGIRTAEDVEALLEAGVARASINSAAVANPQLIGDLVKRFGANTITVAIDAATAANGGWEVVTHGGKRRTGIDATEFARRMEGMGAGEILLTSVDRDGTRDGYDLPLTRSVSSAVSIPVVASGGVGSVADMVAGVLEGGAQAVLAASLFHFREASIREVKQALADAGIPVRL